MIYGYIRIKQNVIDREAVIETQSEQLQSFGTEKIINETDGSQLQELLKNLKPNDVLHVMSIDGLTRSLQRMFELADFFQKNNIALYERNQLVNLNTYLSMYELFRLS